MVAPLRVIKVPLDLSHKIISHSDAFSATGRPRFSLVDLVRQYRGGMHQASDITNAHLNILRESGRLGLAVLGVPANPPS